MCPKSMTVGQTFSLTIQVFDLVKNLAVNASLTKTGSRALSTTEEVLFKIGKFCSTHPNIYVLIVVFVPYLICSVQTCHMIWITRIRYRFWQFFK